MRTQPKLYQILEKAHIATKIAVEIQDWIVDTIEEKRDQGLTSMQETKILPMYQEVRTGFDSIRYEMNQRSESLRSEMNQRFESMQTTMDARFESMQSTMDARFESIEKRLDAINFTIRILGVPIVGATIGGLGVIFLQIYERLFG
ncbi:hypothetical protein EHQ91_00720 [Leptospira biflexa]|uniref:hypothetical protein n=1 Tax=Leptospira biflexa TaxID=172 RepID=UPI00109142BC|nr:hypothetical protein [Leptospira biflexa]TGM57414.1 hypothetical protein EHQ91_00720 [Leptospira biflexa]